MNTVYFEHPKFGTGSIELSVAEYRMLMEQKVNAIFISTEIDAGTGPDGRPLSFQRMPYELHFIQ